MKFGSGFSTRLDTGVSTETNQITCIEIACIQTCSFILNKKHSSSITRILHCLISALLICSYRHFNERNQYELCHEKSYVLFMRKTKAQSRYAITYQLISAFAFAV